MAGEITFHGEPIVWDDASSFNWKSCSYSIVVPIPSASEKHYIYVRRGGKKSVRRYKRVLKCANAISLLDIFVDKVIEDEKLMLTILDSASFV